MNVRTNQNHEMMEQNLQKQVEKTLEDAKKILYKIDSEIDKLEGKDIHKAILAVHDHLLEWNLLGHNFVALGIQDWFEFDEE